MMKSVPANRQIHGSVIKVRQDCTRLKGEISSHYTKWRLQVGAGTDKVNGSNIEVLEERVLAAQGKEELRARLAAGRAAADRSTGFSSSELQTAGNRTCQF